MASVFKTPNAVKALAMDVTGVAPKDIIPDALIIQATTKAGVVEGDAPAVLVPYVDFDADDVPFVPEGDVIPEVDPEDTQVAIFTGKVGLIVPVSREQWGHEDASSLISDAAREALVHKANRAFLTQAAPVAPATLPPAGILSQPITVGTNEIESDLDALIDAIAAIEADGGHATHIIANPLGWAQLQKLKLSDSANGALLGNDPQAAPQRTLSGVPVIVDRDLTPPGKLVVLDRSAILSAYGQVLVAQSSDYLFNQDSIALRITFRFGAKVAKPARVHTVPLAA